MVGTRFFKQQLKSQDGFLFGKNGLGLSLGSSSLKLVDLAKSGKIYTLKAFGLRSIPEDCILNREIMNPFPVSEALKQMGNETKRAGKKVCTGLSGSSIILKRMNIELTNPKEVESEVFWQAEQYLPFDRAEVTMDCHVLSKTKDMKADVLFCAAKLSVMEGYINCITDGGFKPDVVDLEYFALQNIFEANYDPSSTDATAIVDLGASSLKLVVVQDGIPLFTKDAALGGKNLTAEIQKHLGLSFNDAEALKLGVGLSATPQQVIELIQMSSQNFAVEIKRSLDYYNASSSGAPVRSILITGGSSKLPKISELIEHVSGVPTQILNPFLRVKADSRLFPQERLDQIAPFASIPMGLAIRSAQ